MRFWAQLLLLFYSRINGFSNKCVFESSKLIIWELEIQNSNFPPEKYEYFVFPNSESSSILFAYKSVFRINVFSGSFCYFFCWKWVTLPIYARIVCTGFVSLGVDLQVMLDFSGRIRLSWIRNREIGSSSQGGKFHNGRGAPFSTVPRIFHTGYLKSIHHPPQNRILSRYFTWNWARRFVRFENQEWWHEVRKKTGDMVCRCFHRNNIRGSYSSGIPDLAFWCFAERTLCITQQIFEICDNSPGPSLHK